MIKRLAEYLATPGSFAVVRFLLGTGRRKVSQSSSIHGRGHPEEFSAKHGRACHRVVSGDLASGSCRRRLAADGLKSRIESLCQASYGNSVPVRVTILTGCMQAKVEVSSDGPKRAKSETMQHLS